MLVILFRVEVRPAKRRAFIAFIKKDARVAKRDEKGTRQFELFRDPHNRHAFYVCEGYTNRAAFRIHQRNMPSKEWLTRVMPETVTKFDLLFEGQAIHSLRC